MLDPQIAQRFRELPAFHQSFITSDFASEAAETFASSLNLNDEQIDAFENAIILYLLFIFDEKELSDYCVKNLHTDTTNTPGVVAAILKSLPDYITTPVSVDSSVKNTSLASEITETEKELAAVTTNHEVSGMSIRTMADDMRVAQSTTPTISPAPSAPTYQPIYPTPPETIYTSNQSDIFPPPPPAPSHDQNLPPRWDSE